MRKHKNEIWLFLILSLISFCNCNYVSEKGKWTESDKEKFYSQMEDVDFSALGEYKSQMIECYLKKVEASFTSYDEAEKDVDICKKLGGECYTEIVNSISIKGKWCESDKQKFYSQLEGDDLSALAEYKTQIIECYLNKVEANYNSFLEANKDVSGCKNLGFECYNEIVNTISKKGKWSESDKQKFYALMESENLTKLGQYKSQMLECYFNKAEANYSSFLEADNDSDGCKKLGLECVNEFYKD